VKGGLGGGGAKGPVGRSGGGGEDGGRLWCLEVVENCGG